MLHNGALIIERGEVLRCLPLARAARAGAGPGRAHGADPVVHCGQRGEGLLIVEGSGLPTPARRLLPRALARRTWVVVEDAAALAEDPIQVMFGGALEAMEALRARLERGRGRRADRADRLSRDGVGILDVLHPGRGQGGGAGLPAGALGRAAEETLAIGDNWNDREMLEQAGLGLVMGDADPGLLGLGLPVLPSNDEDGVAVAIETHGL